MKVHALRVSDTEWVRWVDEAELQGMSVSAFIRRAVNTELDYRDTERRRSDADRFVLEQRRMESL